MWMSLLKNLKTNIGFFYVVLIVFFLSSCNTVIEDDYSNTEFGSLLWVNEQMPDSVIKVAVEKTLENSSIIIAQIPWDPSDKLFMQNIEWYNSLAKDHGKGLMINIDWLSNDRKSVRNGDWSFEYDSVGNQFKNDIELMVDKFHPKILTLGVEVNYYALTSPNGFKGFINTFNELKNSLKIKYPNLEIGLSFQLELLYGIDKNWVQSKSLHPLDAVVENMDFVGVSTYPDLNQQKKGSDAIALIQLDSILTHYNKPFGISETGISTTNFNSKQRNQYIDNVFQRKNKLMFIVWGSMVDSFKDSNWMDRVGLIDYLGAPKEEFPRWIHGVNKTNKI